LHVLDRGRALEAVADQLAPFLEIGRAAEVERGCSIERCSSMPLQPLARWNSGLAFLTPSSKRVSLPGLTSIWAISVTMNVS
jgi:hypothetical protein